MIPAFLRLTQKVVPEDPEAEPAVPAVELAAPEAELAVPAVEDPLPDANEVRVLNNSPKTHALGIKYCSDLRLVCFILKL